MDSDGVIGLYDRHAMAYDRDRSRSFQERAWLDEFLDYVPAGGTILDLGCGAGRPIARHLVLRGFRVFGVDSSPRMIGLCRERFPTCEWQVGDMRNLRLGRRFDGVLAWDSFFHLPGRDQRFMFTRFAGHAARGAPLMFTSGAEAGEQTGSYEDEPLYHASLDDDEYRRLLEAHGYAVRRHVIDDVECGGHTVWLATLDEKSTEGAAKNT